MQGQSLRMTHQFEKPFCDIFEHTATLHSTTLKAIQSAIQARARHARSHPILPPRDPVVDVATQSHFEAHGSEVVVVWRKRRRVNA